jgi:decaprenylphospho-beta-D-ribofuranose 2-oxidase
LIACSRFDEEKRTLRVEAGATLERVLQWACTRGLRLAVVPGYPRITIGGCIAADVHGKNPARDGTFCDGVEGCGFSIRRAATGKSRATDRPRRVRRDMRRIRTHGRHRRRDAAPRTRGGAERSQHRARGRFARRRRLGRSRKRVTADFAYSWHDGTARGARFGRGLVFTGTWTDEPVAQRDSRYDAMSASSRAAWPLAIWGDATAGSANALYPQPGTSPAVASAKRVRRGLPFARQTLYHRLYGRRGLAELQLLVPHEALGAFLTDLAAIVARIGPPLVMLSMKRFLGTHARVEPFGRRHAGRNGLGAR